VNRWLRLVTFGAVFNQNKIKMDSNQFEELQAGQILIIRKLLKIQNKVGAGMTSISDKGILDEIRKTAAKIKGK
jgi:uncharacterized protein with PIN domain